MSFRSIIIYGGALAIAALSYTHIMSGRNSPGTAPTAERLEPGRTPSMLDKWLSAKSVCDRDASIRQACDQLKREYRHLSDDVIDFMVRLSQFYKHEKPSGILGLLLVESRGDIYNINLVSSAVGGLQTLIPTLSERIIPDKKLAPTPAHARAAAKLIGRVKQHFPHNPEIVDAFVKEIVDFNIAQRESRVNIATLRKVMGMGPKHPDIIKMQAAMKERRKELARTLVTKYPHVLLAVQSVDVLTRYSPEQLRTGQVYQEYVLGPTGANILDMAIANKTRLDADAAKQNKIVVHQEPIPAGDQQEMLDIINAANSRVKYNKLIIPKAPANEVFAAFLPEFEDVAPGNVSLFFTIVTERKTVAIPAPAQKAGVKAKPKTAAVDAKKASEPPRTKTIITRTLVAKTLAEVKQAIHERRNLHDAKAQQLDDHVKRVTTSAANDGYLAPTAPNLVRVVQADIGAPAQN